MNRHGRICRLVLAAVVVVCLPATGMTQSMPYAHTQPAGPIIATNATLNGMVVPNGLPTTTWFEWGPLGSFLQSTPAQSAGNSFQLQHMMASLVGLTNGGIYQCHIVASNAAGVTLGQKQLFTPGKKVAAWGGNSSGQANVPGGLSNGVAVAAGGHHSLTLTSGGQLVPWGYNGNGEAAIPAELTNTVAVACGMAHCLALTASGTVVAWGYNNGGAATVPANLTNVIAVAAGLYHSLALTEAGDIVAWGDNASGQCIVPAGLSNVVAVSGGADHTLALKADGTVVAWGDNYWGQRNVPAGLTNVTAISAGRWHSLALKQDGTVVAWGHSSYNAIAVPGGLTGVVSIAGGYSHSLALKEDGTVVSWGGTISGPGSVPAGLSNVAVIGAGSGSSHCVVLADNLAPVATSQTNAVVANHDLTVQLSALDRNGDPLGFRITVLPASGTLYQFTNGLRGAAILNPNETVTDTTNRVIFAPATNGFGSPFANFQYVANDGELDSLPATITVAVNGRANGFTASPTEIRATTATLNAMVQPNGLTTFAWFEWGNRGSYGQTSAPVSVGEGVSVTRATAAISGLTNGGIYQCRLVVSNAVGRVNGAPRIFTTGRRMTAWGLNTNGQITLPTGLSNVVALAAGTNFSLALKADGSLRAWGDNTHGQATMPAGLSNVVAIASGNEHSLALVADGMVSAWGRNNFGQTTIPAALSNVVAVTAGPAHSLALKADGTVVVWGTNTPGVAPVPANLSNVVALAANSLFNVALKVDGTLATWPNTGYSIPPAGLSNVIAISAAGADAFALRSNFTVVAWGNYPTVPANLSGVVSLSAGSGHCLAVRTNGTVVAWKTQYNAPNHGQTNVPTFLANAVVVAAGYFHSLAAGNNQRPNATAQSSYGYPNIDLVMQLSGTDTNSDLLGFSLAVLPAAGNLYQYTDSGRGAALNALNKPVLDAQGRVIFAPVPDATGRPYTTFTFVANDGEDDSTSATVTVNIVSAPVIDVSSSSLGANGVFSLSFAGEANAGYRVWASTNLMTWNVLGAASQSPPGMFNYTDTGATNRPLRFYRVTCP